jgi:hypothetical protein
MDKNKAYHHRKSNKIDLKTYREVTKSCEVCGFDKVVDLHHLDRNKENNQKDNLVGLCPNHHRMIKSLKYAPEMFKILSEKGFRNPLQELFNKKNQEPNPKINQPLIEFK